MGKSKTKFENELDERFQWHEGLDPDHIFDEEKEMIQILRSKVPDLEAEDDKFVATFLFARRHDMKDVEALLTKFFKKKRELHHEVFEGQHIPTLKYTKILQDNPNFGGSPMLQPVGYRDNLGRMLRYLPLELDNPSSRDLPLTYAILFRHMYFQLGTEPLNAWRNGTVMVLDMKNVGWNNVDFSSKGREISRMVQGTFPTRIRALLMINCGPLVNALSTAAKLVLPRKMMKRVKHLSVEELKDIIPPHYLLPQYGGQSAEFGMAEAVKEVVEHEERLFAEGIWRTPECASTTVAVKKDEA